jgi:hypothetical protein
MKPTTLILVIVLFIAVSISFADDKITIEEIKKQILNLNILFNQQ